MISDYFSITVSFAYKAINYSSHTELFVRDIYSIKKLQEITLWLKGGNCWNFLRYFFLFSAFELFFNYGDMILLLHVLTKHRGLFLNLERLFTIYGNLFGSSTGQCLVWLAKANQILSRDSCRHISWKSKASIG